MSIIAFLGSATFRWLFGELIEFMKSRATHRDELEVLKLQAEVKRDDFARQQAAIESAAAAGVQTVRVQAEELRDTIDTIGRLEATKATAIVTGDWLIDRMNGLVRPTAAFMCLLLIALGAVLPNHVVLNAFTLELCSSILGVFVGGRIKTTER